MKDICPFREAQIKISDHRKNRIPVGIKLWLPVIEKLKGERLKYSPLSQACQLINARGSKNNLSHN